MKRAEDGERDSLRHQESADGRGIEANRSEQPDLANTLLDAQLEEEGGQHQRRNDEKAAEVKKVFTEVRGAA